MVLGLAKAPLSELRSFNICKEQCVNHVRM